MFQMQNAYFAYTIKGGGDWQLECAKLSQSRPEGFGGYYYWRELHSSLLPNVQLSPATIN